MTESEDVHHARGLATVKLIVAAPAYEMARWFAVTNHIHHDDLVFIKDTADLYKIRGQWDLQVWVLGMPHELLRRELRIEVEDHGGMLRYAEPFEVVNLG